MHICAARTRPSCLCLRLDGLRRSLPRPPLFFPFPAGRTRPLLPHALIHFSFSHAPATSHIFLCPSLPTWARRARSTNAGHAPTPHTHAAARWGSRRAHHCQPKQAWAAPSPPSLFSLCFTTHSTRLFYACAAAPNEKKNPRGQCAQVCPPPALMILPTPQKSRSWPPPTKLALFLFSLLGFLPGCSLRSLFPKSLGPNLRGLLLCGFFFGLMSVNNSARRVSLARFSTSPFSRSKGRDTKKGKGSPRFLPFFHRWRRTRRPAHAHTHSTL